MRTPHYYHSGSFRAFETDFLKADGQIKTYPAGKILVSPDMYMDKCYYIKRGVVRFFLIGSNGKEKTISFTGKDSVFPLYSPVQHQFKLQYEVMMMEAFTDVECICITQKNLHKLIEKEPNIALAMLDSYADLADILLYEAIKFSASDNHTQICDFLVYYNDILRPNGIKLDQKQFASCVGTNLLNVARTFKKLRAENIISTSRGHIRVLDYEKLLTHCSADLLPEP